jgi:trigger factor
MEALEESGLEPAAEPEIKDLQFKKGEPLKFAAHIEVWPKFELSGWQGLSMVREEQEVSDQDIEAELDTFRQSQATWGPADRPAQGGDRVALDYWLLNAAGERGEEQQTGVIEVGGAGTPEPFNQALMGVSKGESRRVVLPAVSHTTEEGCTSTPSRPSTW